MKNTLLHSLQPSFAIVVLYQCLHDLIKETQIGQDFSFVFLRWKKAMYFGSEIPQEAVIQAYPSIYMVPEAPKMYLQKESKITELVSR